MNTENLSELAGKLHQAAVNAAEKALEKIVKKAGEDAVYWDIEIELKLTELGADFRPLKRVAMKSEDAIEEDGDGEG